MNKDTCTGLIFKANMSIFMDNRDRITHKFYLSHAKRMSCKCKYCEYHLELLREDIEEMGIDANIFCDFNNIEKGQLYKLDTVINATEYEIIDVEFYFKKTFMGVAKHLQKEATK